VELPPSPTNDNLGFFDALFPDMNLHALTAMARALAAQHEGTGTHLMLLAALALYGDSRVVTMPKKPGYHGALVMGQGNRCHVMLRTNEVFASPFSAGLAMREWLAAIQQPGSGEMP